MKKISEMTQENFDDLLGWLAPGREEAGAKYEEIRTGLIKFFRYKGCSDPSVLADETITRVAAKVSSFNSESDVKTITYFYGFASKIYLEYVRRAKKKEAKLEQYVFFSDARAPDYAADECQNYDCLEMCLGELSSEESKMVVTYYSAEANANSELRKKMAENINLSVRALHTKIHRIRIVLKKCVEKCLNEKNL